MSSSSQRPDGAARLPPRGTPPRLAIPVGNVPGINVDQAGEGGWQYPQSLPSLALRPSRPSPTPASSSRPKLTLSALSTPSPGATPHTLPSTSRPPLLPAASSAASVAAASARSCTPSLRVDIPLDSVGGAGFTDTHGYPDETLATTPVPGEDSNKTVQARGDYARGDYGGRAPMAATDDGASSFRSRREVDDQTRDIRDVLSRMRLGSSPAPSRGGADGSGFRSRAGSIAGMSRNSSRRGSVAPDDASAYSGGTPTRERDRDDASSFGRASIDSDRPVLEEVVPADEYDVNPAELVFIKRLGEGASGSVDKVQNPRTGRVMARKVIARTPSPEMHKQIVRELDIFSSCQSPYIVDHYGAFLEQHDTRICILMEYCEAGSLDSLAGHMRRRGMQCSEHVLGRIAGNVLRGLAYLHDRRIIHRDIKPSNILVTRAGAVKLCDFGVSGELINSVAGTFTGTSYYMAPERISGQPYAIKADVWSLGITLHEVAHLRSPYANDGESRAFAPIELLTHIVIAPAPTMMDDPAIGRVWSEPIKDFMVKCLIKSGTDRPYPRDLLEHPFIVASDAKRVNMARWVAAVCDWPFEQPPAKRRVDELEARAA